MSNRPDPYLVLGVSRDATQAMIRKAYRERARSAHPDLVGDQGLETMRRLNAAWDILRNPGRRFVHDASLSQAGGARSGDMSRSTGADQGRDWTGAAGRPPGRPSGSRIEFGLYSGWTLGEIARHDNGYLMWLAERREGRPFADEIREILAAMRPAESPPNQKNARWRR